MNQPIGGGFMERKCAIRFSPCKLMFGLVALALLAATAFVPAAWGIQFQKGDLTANWDTTLSYGVAFRVEDRDSEIVGLANGGQAFSVNGDDGNLNYGSGSLYSNAFKATSELDMQYKFLGAFVRGSAFYDFEYEDEDPDHIAHTDEALDLVGSDAKILDAYLSASFDIADRPIEIRVGEQLVSWGESTFFQNSINTINPVDVSAIRLPGGELKEALLPEGMIYASAGLTMDISIEGFYLYDWDSTDIDPPGSFFSSNDFAGDGGSRVMLGFGDWSEFGTDLGALGFDSDFMAVPREDTRTPSDDGQFGIALRMFAPFLADTEFGFYYINYHSRVPIISARTGTLGGFGNAVAAGTALQTFAATGDAAGAVAAGAAAGGAVGASDPLGAAQGVLAVAGTAENGIAKARAYITDQYSQTARYLTEYPEDIQLLGMSFNTDLGATGIALQGEFSHRLDVPLQVDDLELLLAALSPLGALNPIILQNQLRPTPAGFEEYIPGFIESDVSQVQMTATKVFGPTFGANTFVLLGEIAWTHIHDMPSKNTLRMEAPGTYVTGNPIHDDATGSHPGKPYESSKHFADEDSWGYRIAGRLVYNNAIGPVNLTPRFAWQHDVQGNTPGPGGNFLEGRKAITLGLTAEYLSTWTFDISYTNFFGAGRYNLINDRDFIGANIKYSF